MKSLSVIQTSTWRHVESNFAPKKRTILIVDDDPMVLNMLAMSLDQSYEVLAAADGVEAAYIYERHLERITALVTDLDLPRLDGQSLAEWVHHINPRLPVIIMSGSIRNRDSEDWRGRISFLEKPFEPSQLEALLREALEAWPQIV